MAVLQNTTVADNGFILISRGTFAQRPTPLQSMLRFNTNRNRLEVYDGIGWVQSPVVELFTNTGTTNWICPAGVTQIRLLVVGAGGGGAGYSGGGGGGNVISEFECPVIPGTSYPIIVGAGGLNTSDSNGGVFGGTGGTSSAFGQSCLGGGGGRGADASGTPPVCGNGGGGGSRQPGYSGTAPNPVRFAIGFGGRTGGNGASGGTTGSFPGGGGAGAGDNGETRTGGKGGDGGNGAMDDILGYPLYWGGGGGASAFYNTQNGPALGYGGRGGLGGGGGGWAWRNNTIDTNAEINGTGGAGLNPGRRANPEGSAGGRRGGDGGPNTGGGAGGGSGQEGSPGGSQGGDGIVIIRY